MPLLSADTVMRSKTSFFVVSMERYFLMALVTTDYSAALLGVLGSGIPCLLVGIDVSPPGALLDTCQNVDHCSRSFVL